jgi:hypothetical protein
MRAWVALLRKESLLNGRARTEKDSKLVYRFRER